ncbi:hypothetical protein CDAR_546491 [Caerostris darwini]|uniref:Uncharacterized protein n=1 Tax=Caerostris darwini TaxID=1538125 RepID=A0AAV4M3Z5_9ARAC|nr:hypothetical protein CDAR_546491 [Caerostris darwini]
MKLPYAMLHALAQSRNECNVDPHHHPYCIACSLKPIKRYVGKTLRSGGNRPPPITYRMQIDESRPRSDTNPFPPKSSAPSLPAQPAQMRGLRARPVVRQVKKLPRPIHVSPHTRESSVISDSTRALARNLD